MPKGKVVKSVKDGYKDQPQNLLRKDPGGRNQKVRRGRTLSTEKDGYGPVRTRFHHGERGYNSRRGKPDAVSDVGTREYERGRSA